MDTKIRVGFIGAGDICRVRHLPGLAKLDQVEVVTICNRSRDSAQKVADEFDVAEVDDNWHQLVQRKDLDAVFIGTWPYMHKEMSIAVLESGKHCFCQARMCMNLAEAKQMLAVARNHPELVNMLCPPPTRMPFEPYIRQLIESDQIGQMTLVELTAVSGGNLDRQCVHWREQVEYSGQQIMAMGIFAETLNAAVGPYEQLSAQTATPISAKTHEDGDSVEIGIPQVVTITGRLENGALAVEHHTGLATDDSSPGSCLTIWGLKGTLRYRFGDNIEFAPAGQPMRPVDVPDELQRPWLVELDFVEAVRAAKRGQSWSVSPDFAEGLLYMRKVEAVHRSAAAGHAVRPAQL